MGEKLLIKKAAVLGAGVMGAQIAAHFANANIEVVLFDMPSSGNDKNAMVSKAIAGLLKLDPAPLSTPEKITAIKAANYDEHIEELRTCDIVIEAIAERLDIKVGLFTKISSFLPAHAIVGSNTSGLSINKIAEAIPAAMRPRFCGVHFFNPPRYMALVELIAGRETSAYTMDSLEEFLSHTLGKSIVRANDTPNFIANRIGIFSFLSTMHHAARLNIPFEVVDALTGPQIGRARSATFRTLDVVGLDVLGHVVKTMHDMLPEDPWHSFFTLPKWFDDLLAAGALGKKAGAGIYKKIKSEIHVYEPSQSNYRLSNGKPAAEFEKIFAIRNPSERFMAMVQSKEPQAQFLVSIFRDLFHYSACHAASIADSVADLDNALRWGFGWEQGPFEIWDAGGFKQTLMWLQGEIAAGRTLVNSPLPAWATAVKSVYTEAGALSPNTNTFVSGPTLPFYKNQLPSGAWARKPMSATTLFENESVRFYSQGDDIGILSFKTKMHTFDEGVLTSIIRAVQEAEKNLKGMVIWQKDAPFSAGANLQFLLNVTRDGDINTVRRGVRLFQQANMTVKYSQVPVVAAVQNLALGGGCELMLHSARVVAALETYTGLVEFGVGLIPAGAGTKELAVRASQNSRDANPFNNLRYAFEAIAMAKVSKSAEDARQIGILRPTDTIIFNVSELLSVAKAEVQALAASYRAPLPCREVRVAGNFGIANFKTSILNMVEGKFISPYDAVIANGLSYAICGGDVPPGSIVSETHLLKLEEDCFAELAARKETQDRIEYMLKTGKPLRN